jgi:sugar lactone lactonase YvrE
MGIYGITRMRRAAGWLLACALAVLIGAPTAHAYVYWTHDAGTIARANLDGAAPNPGFISGATDPYGMAVDGAHVYWANFGSTTIGRADLDGSPASVNPSFITGANQPWGVAVDGAHVYWSNYGSGTIGRANLDGSGPVQNFITGASSPHGVAVDGAHIYWANTTTDTIGRANLDGVTNKVQNFITGASNPRGVAVDGAHIYWMNHTSGTVGRADLDGVTNKNQNFITGASSPQGVAVDGGHIYWDNFGSNRIGRANLDGNPASVDQSFIIDARPGGGTEGVAVDALPVPPLGPVPPLPLPPTPILAAVSRLGASPAAFAAASRGPSATATRKTRPVGTRVSFTLNEAANVRFTVQRPAPGRRVRHGRRTTCDPTRRKNRRKPRCTRLVTLRGSFTRSGAAGKNKFRFTGRLNGRKLTPGSYRLVATPSAGGRAGRSASVAFRIIR